MTTNLRFLLSHAQNSHLVAKISLITQQLLQERQGSLTHSLFGGPHFGVMWVPHRSNPKFDPPVTTAYVWCNACPNFVLLAIVVPEILRLKGVVTS